MGFENCESDGGSLAVDELKPTLDELTLDMTVL